MATPVISESPAIVNLSFVQGDTLFEYINLKDADGDPIDLTDYTVTAEIIDPDGVTVYPFTIAYPSKSQGQTTISLSAANTELLNENSTWNYKLLHTVNQTIKTVLYGKVLLQAL